MAGEPNTLSVQSNKELIGTSTGAWIGRTSLIDNNGVWIQTYRSAGVHGYDAASQIHIRFSVDEGVTWTAEDKFTDGSAVTGFPLVEHDTGNSGVESAPLHIAPNGDLLCIVPEVLPSGNGIGGSWQYRSTDDGASWTDEGQINADATLSLGQEFINIGTDIYAGAWIKDTNPIVHKSSLYKSTTNGTTWTLVSDITSFSDNTGECTIVNTTGNTLLAILRDENLSKTYTRISTDLGLTWGALKVMPYVGALHRPRIKVFADEPSRLYLIGRKYYTTYEKTIITYSDNGGEDWVTLLELESDNPTDCAYCDMLKRADGSVYLLSYKGTTTDANIYEYVLS